jgi:hypothetical protein
MIVFLILVSLLAWASPSPWRQHGGPGCSEESDSAPDQADESSSGCTSDTGDVAEEVSVPTEAPLGSLEAAEAPTTPVVSPSSPTEDETFSAVTGFILAGLWRWCG